MLLCKKPYGISELVFGLTEKHAPSQGFLIITNGMNNLFCKNVLGTFKIDLRLRDWHFFM